jgi:predicted ATPase
VHWIDEVSESMLADLLAVIAPTRSMVLITYRPEYHGALAHVAGAQTIALAPLSDEETATLVAGLLSLDPSVGGIGAIIAGRAAGNPFSAEEISLELAQRSVLVGERGSYTCRTDVAEVGCRPRCRRPSPPASTGSARRTNTRLPLRPSSGLASARICWRAWTSMHPSMS